MPKQDQHRELKTELARNFHAAAAKYCDTLGVSHGRQWGIARRVVNAAQKMAKGGSAEALKKSFQKARRSGMQGLKKAHDEYIGRQLQLLMALQPGPAGVQDVRAPAQPRNHVVSGPPSKYNC